MGNPPRSGRGRLHGVTSRRFGLRHLALFLVLLLAVAACGDGGGQAAPSPGDGDGTDAPADDTVYNLRYSSIFSPGSALQDTMDWWMDEVEERTDGRVVFERFYGASLLAATDTLAGLSEGRAEAGYLVPAYTPGDLPLWNVAMVPGSGAPGGGESNNEAHARALGWMNQNSEEFIAETEGHGVKVLIFMIIGTIGNIATQEPVTDISDLDGMQLRSIGPIAEALTLIGASPVALEAQETYEALQRGVVQGFQGLPMESMPVQGIPEVAPWVVDLNIGHFGTGSLALGLETWDSLPDDIKQIMEEISEEFYTEAVQVTMDIEASACDVILEAGGGITELPADQVEQWHEQIGDLLIDGWREDARSAGATDEQITAIEEDFAEANEMMLSESTYEDGLDLCRERSPEPT